MATTGISALGNDQIIAIAALSSKSAATAEYTTGGDGLQGLYNTVHDNSASWTGGGGGGIEYSGIAPIAVNNVSHEISADMSNYVLVSSNDTQSLSSTKLSYSKIDLWGAIHSAGKISYVPFRYYKYTSAGSPAQKGEFSFLIEQNANLIISASASQEPYIRIGSYSGGSYGYNDVNRAAIQKWNSAYDQLGNVTALLDSL